MKKRDGYKSEEMVSLNQELFSLDAGNLTVEELDRRLELALAAIQNFTCGTFYCGSFGGHCGEFACGTFKMV